MFDLSIGRVSCQCHLHTFGNLPASEEISVISESHVLKYTLDLSIGQVSCWCKLCTFSDTLVSEEISVISESHWQPLSVFVPQLDCPQYTDHLERNSSNPKRTRQESTFSTVFMQKRSLCYSMMYVIYEVQYLCDYLKIFPPRQH